MSPTQPTTARLAVAVTVGAAPAPDLVVDAPTVSESAPAAGARFTLDVTVRNQGNGSSAFTTLRYYQSIRLARSPRATRRWARTRCPASTRQRAETNRSA